MINNRLTPFPGNPMIQQELRQLVAMWAFCCCSPLLYLSLCWIITRVNLAGLLPLSHETWLTAVIMLALISTGLQVAHVLIKLRTRKRLLVFSNDPASYMKLLTKRTFLLILFCELPVFCGFCLYVIHGNLASVFGFGLVSMMLYAQSHPRQLLPAV